MISQKNLLIISLPVQFPLWVQAFVLNLSVTVDVRPSADESDAENWQSDKKQKFLNCYNSVLYIQ